MQVVDEIFDQRAANKMGVDRVGQVRVRRAGGGAPVDPDADRWLVDAR